ncbi:unnamed protein product [Fusarium graminearum]|uniref:Uncharacterized protein n=1 Tax=Gibberella zeae TaxID=5518 RepID=A0A4E9DVM9_GIBZA|nr:unnamed protein product [Fusarium graminearum]CAF3471901.1 unnamed protein product [Fusarium graminearum]CAG1960981.1 unnamed protein product [Fusarium graminearum]CAG1978057.1 unnamed protein product [Fusarium graminearum]
MSALLTYWLLWEQLESGPRTLKHEPQPLPPERFDSVICGLVDKTVDRLTLTLITTHQQVYTSSVTISVVTHLGTVPSHDRNWTVVSDIIKYWDYKS